MFEAVFHFFTFARFRRAMTPSAVTASGSSPCNHFQTARGDTSNSVAASACVSPRRPSSDFSCSANINSVRRCIIGRIEGREDFPRKFFSCQVPPAICINDCPPAFGVTRRRDCHISVTAGFELGVPKVTKFYRVAVRRAQGRECSNQFVSFVRCVRFHAVNFAESANASKNYFRILCELL